MRSSLNTTIQHSNDTIGGAALGAGNIIAFNGKNHVGTQNSSGIIVFGTGNAILGNSIFSNVRLDIVLPGGMENTSGVTANDANDADTGANNLQNFPVLTSVTNGGGMTNITGRLNSAASTNYRLEFFGNDAIDSSSYGKGRSLSDSRTLRPTATGTSCLTRVFRKLVPVSA